MSEKREPNPRQADDPLTATAERIERSWRGLIEALDGVPAERLGERGAVGEWSIKDVMGHVAFWDEQAAAAGERLLRGEPAVEVDWQAMNEREAAAGAGRSAAAQRAAMERAHGAVLDLLKGTPPADPRFLELCGCLRGDTFEHYDEHAADVRAWRGREGI